MLTHACIRKTNCAGKHQHTHRYSYLAFMRNEFTRKIWYSLSSSQRMQVRRLWHLPADLWDRATGKTHRYVPPRGLIFTGSAAGSQAYLEQGRHQVALLQRTLDLQPNQDVLDVGSGVGRTAAALTEYLSSEGSYSGFDIIEKAVDWCKSRIGKDFPNFQFTHVPLHNDLYTSQGQDPSAFTFPYGDASMDVSFSFSVFTHMQPDAVDRYLHETARTLRSDGLAMHTFFVYEPEEEEAVATNSRFAFPVQREGYRLMDEKVTGGNIAFAKAYLQQLLDKNGLEWVSYEPGFWRPSKPENATEYQDVVVMRRKQPH